MRDSSVPSHPQDSDLSANTPTSGEDAVIRPKFSNSPNARSKSVTMAPGADTHGTLNQHPSTNASFQIGVHDDRGQRRTMEDAYSFVVDFAGVRGQGYFAVFDGHAGKYAAEWCGGHFHEHLLSNLRANPDSPMPDILNKTFHSVDSSLSAIADKDDKMHSGCTAVTAFLRIEDAQGGQSFLPDNFLESPPFTNSGAIVGNKQNERGRVSGYEMDSSSQASSDDNSLTETDSPNEEKKKHRGSRIINALKGRSSTSQTRNQGNSNGDSRSGTPRPGSASPPSQGSLTSTGSGAITPPSKIPLKRILYTANAGDARAVLCRAGKAVRLTYDHKGSDKQEAKRIMDAGGFVMGGRVNGVLAVTRSLGDSSMKDFVVGSPYTTETELGEDDEFLILACDGLWDIASDQQAVDLVRDIVDAQEASHTLVEYALKESTDNITVIVIRFHDFTAYVGTA